MEVRRLGHEAWVEWRNDSFNPGVEQLFNAISSVLSARGLRKTTSTVPEAAGAHNPTGSAHKDKWFARWVHPEGHLYE
ncbi:hypothetical protein OC834_002313, partial [Tilletia horrida]